MKMYRHRVQTGQPSGWAAALGPTAIALGLLGSGWAMPATAATYRPASPNDGVIGQPFYLKARTEDTLLDLGRHNGLGYDDMRSANRNIDVWVPGKDVDVLVPTEFVLPNAPRQGIVLNLAEKRLYFYPGGGEVVTHAISIGRDGLNTPVGTFSIVRKDTDPTWRPTAAHHADRAKEGREPLPEVVPPGPDNPLGKYALRLSAPSILIHGTNKPWGLGMEVSRGCIRMYPEGVEDLFPRVPVNTPVTIVKQPFKAGWRGDDLYLEVHAKEEEKGKPLSEVIPPSIANAQGVTVDWDEVRKAVNENTGLPHLVGGRQKPENWAYLDMIF